MITFCVVKETHGWAVRLNDQMTTPFWSRELAIQEAHGLAETLRRHGALAYVNIEGSVTNETRIDAESQQASRWGTQ